MPDHLLDTDVLMDALKGHAATGAALARAAGRGGILFSTVAEAELHAGLSPADAKARAAVVELLSAMNPVPVDRETARRAASYRQRFGNSHGLTLPDALVAASAALRGAVLVTRNRRHFPMDDVETATPAQLS